MLDLGALDIEIDMNFPITSDGMTPLMLSSSFGNLIIVQLVLRNKITDPLITDQHGFNALYYASFYGHHETVTELGKLEVPYVKSKVDETTCLHIACKRGHMKVVELFLNYKSINPDWKKNHPWDG